MSTKHSLTALREAIAIVRPLLRGEEVNFSGATFNVRGVRLDFRPRADIPIFMAARGPNAVKACGEVADGLIVSNMCTAAFVVRCVERMCESAKAAGRARPLGVVQYLPCVPRPDRNDAFRAAKFAVAEMLPAYWALAQRLPDAKRALLDGSGITESELAAATARVASGEVPETVLDDRYVTAFAIAGNIEDCRAQATAHAAAGVTELALTFSGPSAAADMAYLGAGFAEN